MRYFILLCAAVLYIKGCGWESTAQADRPTRPLVCEYLPQVPYDFHRCENDEVTCYMTGNGLSCNWK